jgi:hypothetical protein
MYVARFSFPTPLYPHPFPLFPAGC